MNMVGQILNENQEKDAIHIAIAQVIATEMLAPGDHIGFVFDNDIERVGKVKDPIGIVDPFLKTRVMPNDKFWIFLYPNTVTSLKHNWTHPAFNKSDVFKESRVWLMSFANEVQLTYDELMSAANSWIEDRESFTLEFDTPDIAYDGKEFWKHYNIVTGRGIKNEEMFFNCSC